MQNLSNETLKGFMNTDGKVYFYILSVLKSDNKRGKVERVELDLGVDKIFICDAGSRRPRLRE